jgi:hypothetical protein
MRTSQAFKLVSRQSSAGKEQSSEAEECLLLGTITKQWLVKLWRILFAVITVMSRIHKLMRVL